MVGIPLPVFAPAPLIGDALMPLPLLLTNALLFQVAWFSAVLGAAKGMPWLGVVAIAAVAALHLARARLPSRELALLALAFAAGAIFETLLVQTDMLQFEGGALLAGTAPVWMVALWASFATTLNVSMRALRDRLFFAALLGAIGAPLAYYGGQKLGAVHMSDPGPALAIIAGGWAILTPLLFVAARRFDGYAPR
jgi:hypothetical protein